MELKNRVLSLENQVCSLKLAKKLKELGVEQKSLFYWAKPSSIYIKDENNMSNTQLNEHSDGEDNYRLFYYEGNPINKGLYSAFTVAELGEMLPEVKIAYCEAELKSIPFTPDISKYIGGWAIAYRGIWPKRKRRLAIFSGKTEADVRAEMIAFLFSFGHQSIKED